jgi:hypothetical protein
MSDFKELIQVIFMIWGLFMLGGTVIIFTVLMWHVLRDIYKGEW